MKFADVLTKTLLMTSLVAVPSLLLADEPSSADARRAQAEAAREQQAEQLEAARAQLRAAQNELRESQAKMREAARAMAEAQRQSRVDREQIVTSIANLELLDFPNRAMIGVIMGTPNKENGLPIIGLSPGGPAEAAGIEKGDVIIGVNQQRFDTSSNENSTRLLREQLGNTDPGDTVELQLLRGGEEITVQITTQAREPLTAHSMIHLPRAPDIAGKQLRFIERVVVPEIEGGEIEEKLRVIEEKLSEGEWSMGSSRYNFTLAPGIEFNYEGFSDLANSAIDNTFVWYSGLEFVQGLQFAAMNDDLGLYFETSNGVLVLRAKNDNSLELRAGDVILEINGKVVGQPADVMRELRYVEDRSEVELIIMRERSPEVLRVSLPEPKQLGYQYWVPFDAPRASN